VPQRPSFTIVLPLFPQFGQTQPSPGGDNAALGPLLVSIRTTPLGVTTSGSFFGLQNSRQFSPNAATASFTIPAHVNTTVDVPPNNSTIRLAAAFATSSCPLGG
jgi:hypothetical protein